jgi:hypothetical protein
METSIWLILRLIFTTLLAEKKLGSGKKIPEPESEISFGLHPYLRDGVIKNYEK